MSEFEGMKLKDNDPLKLKMDRLLRNELSEPVTFETMGVTQEEQSAMTMQRLFMTQEELDVQLKQDRQRAFKKEFDSFFAELAERKSQWDWDQKRYQKAELSKNKNDKTLAKMKTPEEIAGLREERRIKSIKADESKLFKDNVRHGFYKFIGAFVKAGRTVFGMDKEEKATQENPTYEVPGLMSAYNKLESMKPKEDDPDYDKKIEEFEKKHGAFYEDLKEQYTKKKDAAHKKATEKVDEAIRITKSQKTEEERKKMISDEESRILEAETYIMKFGDSVQSHVEGGTKPNAFQYGRDGSQWLMKTNHSCIGAAAPNASIMTVAGYKVQKLVNPDTAIEAFESKSKGVGTVSLQRMVEGVVGRTKMENGQKVPDPDYVDLFRFSRTPESMTEEELGKIEKLAPHFLREYMTDYLLGNYDTKGENFLICRDQNGNLTVRGIDKEASGRKDLIPEAQHMQKDKHFFDQDTVYNQLFRKFADGSMNFDLQEAAKYIQRIEQMSTEEYLKIYEPYFVRQQADHPDKLDEIKKNVTYRKEFIRVEARRFFGELVKERMQYVTPEEAQKLKDKYLGGTDNGVFLFEGETAEQLKAEREKVASQKENDAEALEEKIKKADEADEKSYKRRHAMYDALKTVIMGVKKKPGDDYTEIRTTKVNISELENEGNFREWDESLASVKDAYKQHLETVTEERVAAAAPAYEEQLMKEKGQATYEYFLQQVINKYTAENDITEEELQEKNDDQLFLQFVNQAEEQTSKLIKSEARAKVLTEEREAIHKEAYQRAKTEFADKKIDLKMVDDGEIKLGGTKPMSLYYGADSSKWLAKQAVTCVGTTKLSGAYLTEIGSNIQKLIDNDTAVEAFVGQTKKHGVVSFQRMLKNVVSSKKLDLFKFSRHPELATKSTTEQVEALMPQILREHVTDWLLCNFDTKGENFVLTQEEGQPMVLHGIDKEAAFNKILSPDAQQMSTTYKPHANNTLYNVVFEKFANAEMDFDLNAVIPYVQKVMSMDTDTYMEQYKRYTDYLTQKANGKKKELDKVERIKTNIRLRKENLKTDYIRFFTELINRRCEKLHPDEAQTLRNKYFGEGGKEFRFPA